MIYGMGPLSKPRALGVSTFKLILLAATSILTTTTFARADNAVVANHLLLVVDDVVTNIYHNGQALPDSSMKLEHEIFGAMVLSATVEVRAGDSLVFAVANDRFRWRRECGFACAGLTGDEKIAFSTSASNGQWFACTDASNVGKFLSANTETGDGPVAIPTHVWADCKKELNKRVDWQGDTVWAANDQRLVWIKYVCPTQGREVVATDTPPAATDAGTSIPAAAATTRPTRRQSSIKALYILRQENGAMLGAGSDLILTALPSPNSRLNVKFGTPVGKDMKLVLDDVLRYVSVNYPQAPSLSLEFTFEDKYSQHDGGSIGAALGVLMRSVFDNFAVDGHVAITGDVSADGKVRAIGGVGAKLRGAKAAGASIVSVPAENEEQLADVIVYYGAPSIAELQVFGAATLDDAVNIARSDRSQAMQKALNEYADLEQLLSKSPQSLRSKDLQARLEKVLTAAPNHLSAKLLLQYSQNKLRKTLTTGASIYYAMAALNSVIPSLDDNKVVGSRTTVSAPIKEAITALEKLRPIADPQIQPLIDATRGLISARGDYDAGRGSVERLKKKYDEFKDALAQISSNTTLMEKSLREGV